MAEQTIKMSDMDKEDMVFLLQLIIKNHNDNFTKEQSFLMRKLSLAYAERAEELIKLLEEPPKPAMR